MTDQELGKYGELLAQQHLMENGFIIKSCNFRYLKYEIDIIAEKNDKIIVVEVKTRQTAEIGEPWRAVTRKKQKQVIACANFYLQSRNIEKDTRFDIISIVHNSFRTNLEHMEDAFTT